jgi:beta-phosphoglucomutase-like phosphatase (HAD superfamily)
VSLPRAEKVRIAKSFLEDVMPEIEALVEQTFLREVKAAVTSEEREKAVATLLATDRVKTALRQFTTPLKMGE